MYWGLCYRILREVMERDFWLNMFELGVRIVTEIYHFNPSPPWNTAIEPYCCTNLGCSEAAAWGNKTVM